jgi:hypothetical protein
MDILPLEIVQEIFHHLDFSDQINFQSASKYFYNSLRIYRLNRVKNLNDDILMKFSYLKYLDIHNNPNIYNVYHLTNLQILKATGSMCNLSNVYGCTNLTYLDTSGNSFISTFNQLSKLKTLICHYLRNTNMDHGIKYCTNLTHLSIANCGFTQKSIINHVNLTKLNIYDVYHITNINHLTNLVALNISGTCNGIQNDGFSKCTNLVSLEMFNNKRVTNLNHLKKLTFLKAGYSNLHNQSIYDCTNLKQLLINNTKITSINHLTNLTSLSIASSHVDSMDIKMLTNLKKINIRYNQKIKDLSHLSNLEILKLSCGQKVILPSQTNNLCLYYLSYMEKAD